MRRPVTVIGAPGGCPSPVDLARFAAGAMDREATERVMRHVTSCAECGMALRTISADDEDDLTPAELAIIESLPTARPAGRAQLAKRMASERRGFSAPMRLAAAVAGLGVMIGAWWYVRQGGGIEPERLVAQAYSSRRPFPYRLSSGGAPAAIQIQRSQSGLANLTPELAAALDQLNAATAQAPQDAGLMSAAGQAKLLALDLEGATEALERAHRLDPGDDRIRGDLAAALALRSEAVESGAHERPLLRRSLQLLTESVERRPADTTARFNRALVLKALERDTEAAAEFRRCLADERDPAWREEIQRQLSALER